MLEENGANKEVENLQDKDEIETKNKNECENENNMGIENNGKNVNPNERTNDDNAPKEEDIEGIINEKDKEIEELNNKLLRLQADFINYKKRIERERESIINFAIEPFVTSLLPIVDNLERALESQSDKEDNFYKGIEMIYDQLIKVLKDNEVEEIPALNEDFDPNYHHAIYMEENEEYESGKIIEVFQKGYKLKGKVIRPSLVKVAK